MSSAVPLFVCACARDEEGNAAAGGVMYVISIKTNLSMFVFPSSTSCG